MPKFSILIPIIKGKFLKNAIESVLSQTFSDWELIMYNDYSPDNIDEIVKCYQDNKIKYLKGEKNLGAKDPSKVWNKMLEMATGEYICLLGDDDLISQNYLAEINNLITQYPTVSIFRTGLKRISENGTEILNAVELPKFETWDESFYQRAINKRTQSTSEFVIKKEALLKIGGYINFPRACGSDDATYLLLMKENGIASTNKAFACWRKSTLNISDNDNAEINEYKIKFILEWERKFLDKLFSTKVPLGALYDAINNQLKQPELDRINNALNIAKSQQEVLSAELSVIHASYTWKIAWFLQKILNLLIPQNTIRNKLAVSSFRILRKIMLQILEIKKRLWEIFSQAKNRIIKPTPRIKITPNLKSKKLVYVDHSYHNKTKSNTFLLDYLQKEFELEIIQDESWQGKPFPDLSFADEKYLGIIFFQNLPSTEILKTLKNNNLIFFPMYDQSGNLGFDFWNKHRNLKIINFSQTLHKKLLKWGIESTHIKYFPPPEEFIPGEKNEVFFWQRLTDINFNTFKKLLGNTKLKIHIHKALDPGQTFLKPKKADEQKFQITYSNWFETKTEMQDLIKQKGIYIAPRNFEGIGLSFLEAMAMGKAVIAVDNPTMNEYIIHNETGYLFNLKKSKKIDLFRIEEIQKNTHVYMQAGYKKWEIDKKIIIDIIKSA
jgi:glycosyltransferase involved in cell wall biosynthesis